MPDLRLFFAFLHLALPFAYVFAWIRHVPHRGLSWCVVAGLASYQVTLFTLALSLGHAGFLAPVYFRTAVLIAFAGLIAIGIRGAPARKILLGRYRYQPQWADLPIGLAALACVVGIHREFVFDWSVGPLGFDSVSYHIPRALVWSWHGNLQPWRAHNWQQLASAYGGAATLLPYLFLGFGWLGAAYTTLVFSVGGAAALFVIARSFGLSRRASLLSSLAFFSFPTVGLRLSDISTDMAATFPILAAVALFRTLPTLRQSLFVFVALAGLGTATKQYVGFAAAPLGLALAAPRFREILADRRCFLAVAGGGLAALVFLVLSLLPVYRVFGDLVGGPNGAELSNLASGYRAWFRVTAFNFLTWFAEPLCVLSTDGMNYFYHHLGGLYRWLGQGPADWYPRLDPERNRSGFLPLLAFPWLLLGVKRGARWWVVGIFLVVCFMQFGFLAVNFYGARFAILPLSIFALLWGARAERMPSLVAIAILIGLSVNFWNVTRKRLDFTWLPHYQSQFESFREARPMINGETVSVLTQSLSPDAFIAGRLPLTRIEYVSCPLDGNWVDFFKRLGSQSRWFLFNASEPVTTPGPYFSSALGPPCPQVSVSSLRGWLETAGWRRVKEFGDGRELWASGSSQQPSDS